MATHVHPHAALHDLLHGVATRLRHRPSGSGPAPACLPVSSPAPAPAAPEPIIRVVVDTSGPVSNPDGTALRVQSCGVVATEAAAEHHYVTLMRRHARSLEANHEWDFLQDLLFQGTQLLTALAHARSTTVADQRHALQPQVADPNG